MSLNPPATYQQTVLDASQARGEIATGLIQVYRAIGGGWQIRLTGCTPAPLPIQPEPAPAPPPVPAPSAESPVAPPEAPEKAK